MILLACFWIAVCLVVDTSTKSVTSTDDKTSTGDHPISLQGNADWSTSAEKCKCDNGVCKENNEGKFVCTCPPEWGYYTASQCKKCDCGKDSNCTFSSFWNRKTCICIAGYEDIQGFCKGTCKTNPCLNGGVCTVKGNDIACKCKNPFAGKMCDKASATDNKPPGSNSQGKLDAVSCNETADCKNGGICEKSGDNSACRCRTGTEGSFCEDLPACADMKCGQDAECMYNVQLEKALCQCLNNSLSFDPEDKRCKRTCYDDKNCMNGAKCKRVVLSKFCKCLKGTEGGYCEEISECKDLNCGPDAQCTYDVQTQTAMCLCADKDSYFDHKQRICRNPCSPNPCQNGGICKATREEVTCLCKESFKGADCSIDVCSPNPCQNGGICNATRGQATCQCKDRYKGADCSIDVCSPNPCQNGGICNATRGQAKCQCKHGFKGADCSIGICSPNPCQNGGICNATRGQVTCQCKDRFKGVDCSIDVCSPNPCQNGGICNATRGQVTCQCKDRYKGSDCSIDVCSPNPCQNDGICKVTRGQATCQCKDSFKGVDCSTDVCSPNPCKNGGICNFTRGQVTCQCKDSFSGIDCSIDVCWPNPCRNDGNCTATRGQAMCQCRHPFTGADCSMKIPLFSTSTSVETLNITRNSTIHPTHHPTSSPSGHSLNFTIGRESTLRLTTLVPTTVGDPCTESPCQNGGTCVVVGNSPKCLCKKPYLGNLCDTDPCDWNPCKNGGLCKTEYETVRCFCKEPFTGEFCESRIRIDAYVITLLAGSVFLAIILTFVSCILCQRYHVMRTRSEYS